MDRKKLGVIWGLDTQEDRPHCLPAYLGISALRQKTQPFSCREPGSKYFQLCGPCSVLGAMTRLCTHGAKDARDDM